MVPVSSRRGGGSVLQGLVTLLCVVPNTLGHHSNPSESRRSVELQKRFDNTSYTPAPLYGPSGRPQLSDIGSVTDEKWVEGPVAAMLISNLSQLCGIQSQDANGTIHTGLGQYSFSFNPSGVSSPAWYEAFAEAAFQLVAVEAGSLEHGPPQAQRASLLLNAIFRETGFSLWADCELHKGHPNPYGSRPVLAWNGVEVLVVMPDNDHDDVPIRLIDTTQNVTVDIPSNIPFAVSWVSPADGMTNTTTAWANWKKSCQQLMFVK